MILMTTIARVADALPLAASMQEDETAGRSLMEYQQQSKQLFRKISGDPAPPSRGSVESGPYIFHYLIERGVCFLILCDKSFSKKLAFGYLDDLQGEFVSQYGDRIETVSRPYSFIEFDTYIQRARKTFMDSRARKSLNNINSELQDVHRIMIQNIDDVLDRGKALSDLDSKAMNLSHMSQKYRKDAHYLNLRSQYAKIAALVVVIVVIVLFLYYLVFK